MDRKIELREIEADNESSCGFSLSNSGHSSSVFTTASTNADDNDINTLETENKNDARDDPLIHETEHIDIPHDVPDRSAITSMMSTDKQKKSQKRKKKIKDADVDTRVFIVDEFSTESDEDKENEEVVFNRQKLINHQDERKNQNEVISSNESDISNHHIDSFVKIDCIFLLNNILFFCDILLVGALIAPCLCWLKHTATAASWIQYNFVYFSYVLFFACAGIVFFINVLLLMRTYLEWCYYEQKNRMNKAELYVSTIIAAFFLVLGFSFVGGICLQTAAVYSGVAKELYSGYVDASLQTLGVGLLTISGSFFILTTLACLSGWYNKHLAKKQEWKYFSFIISFACACYGIPCVFRIPGRVMHILSITIIMSLLIILIVKVLVKKSLRSNFFDSNAEERNKTIKFFFIIFLLLTSFITVSSVALYCANLELCVMLGSIFISVGIFFRDVVHRLYLHRNKSNPYPAFLVNRGRLNLGQTTNSFKGSILRIHFSRSQLQRMSRRNRSSAYRSILNQHNIIPSRPIRPYNKWHSFMHIFILALVISGCGCLIGAAVSYYQVEYLNLNITTLEKNFHLCIAGYVLLIVACVFKFFQLRNHYSPEEIVSAGDYIEVNGLP